MKSLTITLAACICLIMLSCTPTTLADRERTFFKKLKTEYHIIKVESMDLPETFVPIGRNVFTRDITITLGDTTTDKQICDSLNPITKAYYTDVLLSDSLNYKMVSMSVHSPIMKTGTFYPKQTELPYFAIKAGSRE